MTSKDVSRSKRVKCLSKSRMIIRLKTTCHEQDEQLLSEKRKNSVETSPAQLCWLKHESVMSKTKKNRSI